MININLVNKDSFVIKVMIIYVYNNRVIIRFKRFNMVDSLERRRMFLQMIEDGGRSIRVMGIESILAG